MVKLFDSNGELMLDDPKFFETYVEKILIGMKRKFLFYEIPYWEHLNIFDLRSHAFIKNRFNLFMETHIVE
jgi:hypothetical protein